MGAKRLAASWFLRVGVATAILSGIGILASPGSALAAELPLVQDMAPVAHAILFFAAALFVETLRIRRVHGRGCLALCRAAVNRNLARLSQRGQSARAAHGRSGGAGISVVGLTEPLERNRGLRR